MKIDKKEIARDLMALGSIPFLLIVLIRVLMAGNFQEMVMILIALGLVLLTSLKIKNINMHVAILVIIVIFTSIFYSQVPYTIFAGLIAIVGTFAIHKYLKRKKVITSAVIAIVCSIISYFITLPLNIPNY